jgi:hypothetical protein
MTFPVTFEQEAIWLADHLAGGASRYLESWAYRLTGDLDTAALRWALGQLAERHEALRTVLACSASDPGAGPGSGHDPDGELQQVVLPPGDVPLHERAGDAGALNQELRAVASAPLDLDRSPMRATLLRLGPGDCVLVVQFHHAVIDDWALTILDAELGSLYTAQVTGVPAALPPLPGVRLGEYALAQRSLPADAEALSYWQGLLRELPPRSAPPADRRPSPGQGHRAARVRFRLGPEVTALVRQQCRALRTTPFTLLATVLAALLGNSGGPDGSGEVMLGTPVTRRTAETDGLVGCLTDLLPLRLAAPPAATFAEATGATRAAVRAALAQPGVPYPELVKRAAPRRVLKDQPLCPCVLVVDDARRAPLALAGLSAERVYVPPEVAKFPLCLTLVRQGTSYLGLLDYSRDLYGARTGQRIATGFQLLLGAALREPGAPLGRLRTSIAPDDHVPISAR